MNGPQHYLRAEALLDSCQRGGPENTSPDEEGRAVEAYPGFLEDRTDPDSNGQVTHCLLAALTHATLAHAAAVAAQSQSQMYLPTPEWREVIL